MGKKNRAEQLIKRQQDDRQARAQAFMDEYRTISEKYRIDFCAELAVTANGIKPVLKVRELAPQPEMKPWSEAKRENLENRKLCVHELSDSSAICKKCGLERQNWGEEGKGATEAYVDRVEAQINKIKAEEDGKANGEVENVEADESESQPAKEAK